MFCANAQALAELSEAGLSEEKVEMLWDLYSEARQAQEDKSGVGGAAGVGALAGQPAGTTQAVEGAGRVGMFALGVLSRLLTVLRLMYAVSRQWLLLLLLVWPFLRHGDAPWLCLPGSVLCQSSHTSVQLCV